MYLTGSRAQLSRCCCVSMPSTSGDTSDRTIKPMPSIGVWFQCPQHRAMHLTHSLIALIREGKFQCPQHRAIRVTLRPNWNGRSNFISRPLTSGDPCDKSMDLEDTIGNLFQCSQHRAMHLTKAYVRVLGDTMFQCPQHRAMQLTTRNTPKRST